MRGVRVSEIYDWHLGFTIEVPWRQVTFPQRITHRIIKQLEIVIPTVYLAPLISDMGE